jgi:tetratricopeptide (TPR) repeat protein
VADNLRIEELRRRVLRDKASIAFAQLAEEYRRAGRFAEAIDTCRTGLAHHPGYLSAHVTLGRALIETGELQVAQDELTRVHAAAPENLAAIKGLAEIHHRRGERAEALSLYSRALELVPHDPELEHQIEVLQREMAVVSPAPDAVPAVAAAPAADPPAASDPSPPDPRTPVQIEALERWLDAILADRDNRP